MMTTALFGKPQAGGVQFVDATLVEQATIVCRAIHTLELLGEHDIIQDDDSIASMFVAQSWHDLKRLLAMYEAQGVRVNDIDMGEYRKCRSR